MTDVMATTKKIIANVEKVIVGKRRQVILSLVSWFCEGHILLEDVPGVAKTMLARALAKSVGCSFKRIQCTPDLLPADITGISVFDQKSQSFRFLPGPVFTNILLADEINRTSPRTQSALLEAMAERTVTVDRRTRKLPATFMVIATQNPIEFSGTFPLPEAQLDRFFMRVSLGYPTLEEEARIMQLNRQQDPLERITPVLDEARLQRLQQTVDRVQMDQKVVDYIAALIHATRAHKHIRLGVSPRGAIALMKAAQANALLHDETYVTPHRVQSLVAPVLAHRILLRSSTDNAERLLSEIVAETAVPAMPGEPSRRHRTQRFDLADSVE